ncbi:MAG: DUF4080 domain-containing protein [Gammaproteobacteria bacterium]|nr:DUF4080 domain-containing protein [Gammaproteobacteria bacterium]
MSRIILCTINARYIHSAFGLRYLLANMGELKAETLIREFTLEVWPVDIVEQLLGESPEIIGFGVYIWNLEPITRLVGLLKTVRPDIQVVLGGPEVSYDQGNLPITAMADYVVAGQADLFFGQLCSQLLEGDLPAEKFLTAPMPDLKQLALPYRHYTEQDIASRVIYVEASRGCPFKCEFCLSALDKTTWSFNLNEFLREIGVLHDRGARRFKFVDRTFNLQVDSAVAILEFFLARMDEQLFLHFEVVPDRLPERLRAVLSQFPSGSLQLEVGIQSFDSEVQSRINRRQNGEETEHNLRWLRQSSQAHIHADLIIGLPGEGIESFAEGFDRLVALNPQEIQVGVLKKLRGSTLGRHDQNHAMRYNPDPPYNVLSTGAIDFFTMQRLVRFARHWDMIANSERFPASLPLILGASPFERFLCLSDWLYRQTGRVHQIALKRLFMLFWDCMTGVLGVSPPVSAEALGSDYASSGIKGRFVPGGAGNKPRSNSVFSNSQGGKAGISSTRDG